MVRARPRTSFSAFGLLLAAGYFLISTSPSLLPRAWYYQGLVSGICAATGYGLGALLAWVGRRLAALVDLEAGIGRTPGQVLRRAAYAVAVVAVVVITTVNVRAQARTASLVGMRPPGPADWPRAVALAVGLALGLVGLARLLRRLTRRLAAVVGVVLPTAVASAVATVVVAIVVGWVANNVVFRESLEAGARIAAQVNSTPPAGRTAPTSPLRSGSPQSLESWDSLGFQGQLFVTSGPDQAQISAATGQPAMEPIRVYAGLSGDRVTVTARSIAQTAAAVVRELRRTGAFERKVLAVITTTGTGWVDDWTAESIEYLSDGDSAIAAMQYSYLPSGMAFLADLNSPAEAGKALFDAVYAVWETLPAGHRPLLVVGGESLGSYGGQAAFSSAADMLARAQGGVWVGTPHFTPLAASLRASRNPGSPEIAPVVDDGRHIRFATSPQDLTEDYYGRPFGSWEYPRFVYAQHPSDPVVWWDSSLVFQQPDWLREPRGRDVSDDVTWIPIATFWQLTMDLPIAVDAPSGHGHHYNEELVPEWAAVLGRSPTADYSRIIAAMRGTVTAMQ
jgi:uncharacterized membrane protein